MEPIMADLFTATGATFEIGPTAADTVDTASEFAALTPYVVVGLIESYGEIGDQSSIVTGAVVGDGRMRKAKGARDAGDFTVTCFHAGTDAGQLALIAGEATYLNYAFRITFPNVGSTAEKQYFRGLITSKRVNIGANDNLVRDTFTIAVNSPIVVVAPT
jgi:hypothetical protein